MQDLDDNEWEDNLLPEDDEWIEEKLHSDISSNAKTFLRKLRHKMNGEIAVSNEVFIDEKDAGNTFGLFFFRSIFHYFTIGVAEPKTRHIVKQITVDSFREAMTADLSELGIQNTMWGFLANADFTMVRYDRNYDLM